MDIDYVTAPESTRKTIVAIIDSGIAARDDLNDRLFINEKEIPCDSIDNDNNGYIDDYYGWDFSRNIEIDYTSISSPHATEVAHIIAGSADWWTGISTNALLLNIRIAEENITPQILIEAINYAEKMGADIVNLSLTFKESDIGLYKAIRDSRMLFVCAAGNQHTDRCLYPGNYDLDNVISVGGINNLGIISSSSNYGENVDIAAPGENIAVVDSNGETHLVSGTSFAVPFVTAAASEIIAQSAFNITAKDVKQILIETCNKYPCLNGYVGCAGIVSMKKAIEFLLNKNFMP